MDEFRELETYLTSHAEDIVRMLRGIPPERQITAFEKRLRSERLGNPFSTFLRGDLSFREGNSDSTATANAVQFYIQHFNGSTDEQIGEEPADLKFFAYDIFKSSGITPIPFKIAGFPKAILLTSLGDMTMEEKQVGQNVKERARLFNSGLELLSGLHHHGRKVIAQIVSNERVLQALRQRNAGPHLNKAVRALRAYYSRYQGDMPNEAVEEEFRYGFSPLAWIYDNPEFRVVPEHGDFGAQNILGKKASQEWRAENMGVIDLTNLRFNHFMLGVARLGTSFNMFLTPAEWNAGIAHYMRHSATQTYDVAKYRETLLGKIGQLHLQPDVEREIDTLFYAGAIFEPWKMLGYTDRVYLESEQKDDRTKYKRWVFERPTLLFAREQMGRNSGLALDYVIKNPERFLWNEEHMRSFERLRTFWKNEGYIPAGDIGQETMEKIAEAYEEKERKLAGR